MQSLKVVDLYNKISDNTINNFNNKKDSSLRIIRNYEKIDCNYEWLELMENTIRYLDNIFRNPNKFIVNEEDVIKIELAKRVTVESIKHLSRNTNLIQDYNKKTGDVKPSKILNISKEESFDTYENRLIYTLIQNMKFYINRKKKNLDVVSSLKDKKKLEYNATSLVGNEKIDMNMVMNTNVNSSKNKENNAIKERIEKLEIQIAGLCNSDVYKSIEKLHITLITPPIKKTNVIIKNVNFQYAMKLWDYLQNHIDDDIAEEKINKDYMDDDKLKQYMDETFLLNYLTATTLNGEEEIIDKQELSEKLVSNMVNKVMDINKDIPLEQLQQLVKDQYTIVKYKNVVSDKKIEEIFKAKIDKYMDKINKLRI